jgi:RNase H-like domain found in reverse transcriptase/Reverse transcriptase (RNA-dependent DNA polymerase)/Integrase core domain/Integrase zinc binding domain
MSDSPKEPTHPVVPAPADVRGTSSDVSTLSESQPPPQDPASENKHDEPSSSSALPSAPPASVVEPLETASTLPSQPVSPPESGPPPTTTHLSTGNSDSFQRTSMLDPSNPPGHSFPPVPSGTDINHRQSIPVPTLPYANLPGSGQHAAELFNRGLDDAIRDFYHHPQLYTSHAALPPLPRTIDLATVSLREPSLYTPPKLMELTVTAIRAWLVSNRLYMEHTTTMRLTPVPIPMRLNPDLIPQLAVWAKTFGIHLPDITRDGTRRRDTPFLAGRPGKFAPTDDDSDSDVVEEVSMQEWSQRCLDLLYAVVDDNRPDYDLRIEDVKTKLKSTLRWNATLSTFKDSFLNFQSQWTVFLDTYRCKHLFSGSKGRKLATSLITGQLFPPAFKDHVMHVVEISRKTLMVHELWELILDQQSIYTALQRARKLQREGAATKQKDDSSSAVTSKHRSFSTSTPTTASLDSESAAARLAGVKDTKSPHVTLPPPPPPPPVAPVKVPDTKPPRPPTNSASAQQSKPPGPCRHCGSPDHFNRHCPTRPKTAPPKASRAAHLTTGDGAVIIADTKFSFVADSGATNNFISTLQAQRLFPRVTIRPLSKPITIATATHDSATSSPHVSRSCMVTDITLTFPTGETRTVHDVQLYIVDDFGDDILLGRPLLHKMNVDVVESLKAACRRARIVNDDPERDASDTDSLDEAASAGPVFIDVPRFQDADEGKSDTDVPIGPVNSDEVRSAVNNAISSAQAEGLSDAGASKLREALLQDPLLNTFRTQLGPDPPMDAEPVRVEVDPAIKKVKQASRFYSPLKSAFLLAHTLLLVSYGFLYPNDLAVVASPAHPVRRHNVSPLADPADQFRLTVDLRVPNKYTYPTQFPIPHLDQVASAVAGATHFASMDLFNGFWQMALHPDSQPYFSIKTDRGVFTPTRLIQGSKNASGPFHAAVTRILDDYVGTKCIVYIDDILIFASCEAELVDNIIAIVQRLNEYRVKINAKKTVFFKREVAYCGRVFSAEGVSFNPEFISAVTNMSEPTTASQLRQYLASANWIRSSIPSFSSLTEPLQSLLTVSLKLAADTNVNPSRFQLSEGGWNDAHRVAFHNLNAAIAHSVTLAYPDQAKTLCVFTDASDLHWSGVITQCDDKEFDKPFLEQNHQPLAFISGHFSGSQLRWPTVEQEAFAIKETILRGAQFLQHSRPFIVHTDHRNLRFMFSPEPVAADARKQAAERLERWAVTLRAFHFVIRHIPGDLNVCADMLSRWAAPHHVEIARVAKSRRRKRRTDPVNPTFAPNVAIQFNVADAPTEVALLDAQLRDLNLQDPVFLAKHHLRKDVDGFWLYSNDAIYVPDLDHLRLRICIVAHQGPAGHRGSIITFNWIREHFWWPSMERDVNVFTRTCHQCLLTTGGHTVPRPLRDTLHATQPNQVLHFDFFYVAEPTADTPHQYKYILVIMDGFSRFVELHPAADNTASTVVNALMDWFKRNGIAKQFVSDNGTHFLNAVVSELSQRLLIEHHFTTVYAPWSNGRVERVNKEIKRLLTSLRSEAHLTTEAWVPLLPVVNYVLNNTPTPVLNNHTPFEAFLGRLPTSPLEVIFLPDSSEFVTVKPSSPEVTAIIESLKSDLHSIHEHVLEATVRPKPHRPGEQPVDFGIDDYVLYADNSARTADKTRPHWLGPARVIQQVESDPQSLAFLIKDLVNDKVKQVHAVHLKRYADKDLVVTPQLKEFIAQAGSGANIANIIGHQYQHRQWKLNVHWEGYPVEEATWEPFTVLASDAAVLTTRYVKSLPDSDPHKATLLKLLKKP